MPAQANLRSVFATVLTVLTVSATITAIGVAEKFLPSRTEDDAVISDFREWLSNRLGPLAVAVLDSRVNGDDMTNLVGNQTLGSPTRHKIRTTLQAIKQAAWEYADGDASLRSRIEELLDQDRQRAERMRVAGARADA